MYACVYRRDAIHTSSHRYDIIYTACCGIYMGNDTVSTTYVRSYIAIRTIATCDSPDKANDTKSERIISLPISGISFLVDVSLESVLTPRVAHREIRNRAVKHFITAARLLTLLSL